MIRHLSDASHLDLFGFMLSSFHKLEGRCVFHVLVVRHALNYLYHTLGCFFIFFLNALRLTMCQSLTDPVVSVSVCLNAVFEQV